MDHDTKKYLHYEELLVVIQYNGACDISEFNLNGMNKEKFSWTW